MRYIIALFSLSLFLASSATAKPLALDPVYLRSDGAIMTLTSGHLVDPYFPTKALIMAQDAGMNNTKLATAWIKWMLARQNENGLFSRYCFKEGEQIYDVCANADADDAMLAMWIELLYRMAPRTGLPKAWQESAEKAQYQLDTLYNPQATVFFISSTMPVGLLMDNIEIYAAFKRIEREAIRLGDSKLALAYRGKAEHLKIGIITTFWDDKNKRYIASTQSRSENSFYPDTVVQLIPMFHGFTIAKTASQDHFYKDWMKQHRNEWFALIGNDYPWGMLAVLADKRGDFKTASCWLQQTTPYRHTNVWNILDETAFQIVQSKLQGKNTQCTGDAL